MAEIEKFFMGGASQIEIPPGEYMGPLTIRHSCVVDGHGATLWTKNGAALIIDAPNVMVKNLRVELMMKTKEFIAIEVMNGNVNLENVEVYGNIRGYDKASENWELPRTIDFGNFAANERNEFLSRFKLGEPCRVINSVYGLSITPQNFSAGEFDLRLTIAPMKDGMILYGSFLLETSSKILRRIYVSGRAQKGATIKTAPKPQVVPPPQSPTPQPPQQKIAPKPQVVSPTSQPLTPKPPQQKTAPKPQVVPPTSQPLTPKPTQQKKSHRTSNKVKKGQQISAPNSENIRVAFRATNFPSDMTIDAYAFCLGKNKKVQRDTDLIFFNNPRHESLGVSLNSKKDMPGIDLALKNLPEEIQSVVICFGIYDAGNQKNFSKVSSPEVVIFADENIAYEFPVQLVRGKIFTALEIYSDKDAWKIHFIGLSSDEDFTKLCDSYGVEVF